jgi:hypothetical protein
MSTQREQSKWLGGPTIQIRVARGYSAPIDSHHRFLRYGWPLLAPDGTSATEGVDFAQMDVDGRLFQVVGFFGTSLPPDPYPRAPSMPPATMKRQ